MSLDLALSLLADAQSGLGEIARREREVLLPGAACGRIDELMAAIEAWPADQAVAPSLSAGVLRRARRLHANLSCSVDRLQNDGFDARQLDGVFQALLVFEQALEREGRYRAEAVSDAATLLRLEIGYVLTAPRA